MTNNNLYTFVRAFSFLLRAVTDKYRPNSIGLLVIILTFLWSLLFLITFIPVDQNSQSTVNFVTAQNQKNEFSNYERGKSLIQRQHPSNVQLPTTRRGIHSTPNNPVKKSGGFLDRIYSVTCCKIKGYSNSMNPYWG